MERFVNTDKPLSLLTGIRQVITKGDNDTNIKYQSKTKLEGLNNLLFDRQQNINQIREIEKDIYHNIISKLKRLLSTKFVLSEQDYLLLIDKFQLKKNELSREKIKDMIKYLNFQKKYDEKPSNLLITSKPIIDQSNMNPNPLNLRQNMNADSYSRIIPPDFEPEVEYLDNHKSKTSLEDKLKIMQLERDKLNPQINPNNTPNQLSHTNFNNQNSHLENHNHNILKNNTTASDQELYLNSTKINHNNYKKSMQQNVLQQVNQNMLQNEQQRVPQNMKQNVNQQVQQNLQYNKHSQINLGESINMTNLNINNKQDINSTNFSNKPINIHKDDIYNSEYNSDILNHDSYDGRPKLIIDDTVNNNKISEYESTNQNEINLKIENSLKQIADNLSKNNIIDEETIVQEIKSMNLMANIISTKSAINSTSENLEFNINYNGNGSIENVVSIELVSCFINHNFYDKNSFSKIPYLLIKIKEFEDILYLNDTDIGGFCQIIWERKPNDCYTYINSDKLFGVYTPKLPIKLDKLTIELFNHRGEPINIKSTDKDQFNLVFKIKQNI